MVLHSIYLSRVEWGEEKGTYSGQVTFADPERKIELKLNKDLASRILQACGNEVLNAGRELSIRLEEASRQALLGSPEAVNDPE